MVMRAGTGVRRRSASAGIQLLVATAIPMVAAMAVVGTYFGQELVVFAGLLSLSMLGFLVMRPMIGVAIMTVSYMAAAYPSALNVLGVFSVINMLGVCLLILLLAHILGERDLSFATPPPVVVLMVIGMLFVIGSIYAEWQFPGLQVSRATGRTGYKIIDTTGIMTEAFVTRLAFLVFLSAFVRTRADLRVIFYCFVLSLFMAIPSALANWGEGELRRGFRVAASLTAGSNANRLGMICCFQVLCWWYWYRARPSLGRRLWAMAVIIASVAVLSGTGSRSALIGAAVTLGAMLIGARGYRVSGGAALAGIALFGLAIATVAPERAVERMFAFFPQTRDVTGASSIELRETTIETGKAMIRDHPWTGVGLGNFREVSRQVYADKYFRPPHNSVLWATAEGGVFVLLGYAVLFWIAWRDFQRGMRMERHDTEVRAFAMAMQRVLVVFLVYSFFADLWLSPLTYVIVGFAYAFRRCAEATRPVPAALRAGTRAPRPMGMAA